MYIHIHIWVFTFIGWSFISMNLFKHMIITNCCYDFAPIATNKAPISKGNSPY